MECAGVCGGDGSFGDINQDGLLNVLEAARLTGVKNIIFFSSLTVHGAQHDNDKKVNEDDIYLLFRVT